MFAFSFLKVSRYKLVMLHNKLAYILINIYIKDLEGRLDGQTTSSMMDLEIIGNLREDFAMNVHFEDIGESFWFTE
ncbi:MAG: hypothetical protein M9949_01985 [Candidatus Kapabacteria bacterium]|nr:hypothetical protein [Candidatus Kapabacteria bacterium]